MTAEEARLCRPLSDPCLSHPLSVLPQVMTAEEARLCRVDRTVREAVRRGYAPLKAELDRADKEGSGYVSSEMLHAAVGKCACQGPLPPAPPPPPLAAHKASPPSRPPRWQPTRHPLLLTRTAHPPPQIPPTPHAPRAPLATLALARALIFPPRISN